MWVTDGRNSDSRFASAGSSFIVINLFSLEYSDVSGPIWRVSD